VLERVPLDPSLLSGAEIATTLLNRGLAHAYLLQFGPGRRALRRALEVATTEELAIHRFKATHNLGCLEYVAGNIPEALRLMREADTMPVDVDRARARLDRARVLADAGLLDQAEEDLRSALRSSIVARLPLDRGDIHLDLALCAVLRDDLEEARGQARRASRAFTSRQAWSRRDEARLVRAIADVVAGHATASATRTVRSFHPPDRPVQPVDRLVLRLEAELALARQDAAVASNALARLARGPRQPVGIVLHERALRARTLILQGRPSAARGLLRDSASLLARHQGYAVSLDVRAAMALHGRRIRDVDVGLALTEARPDRVFDSVERWRAASQRAPLAIAEPDGESAALLTRLRTARQLILHGNLPDGDPVRAEATMLEQAITERAWTQHSVRGEAPAAVVTLTATQIEEQLGTRTALLSFFSTGDRLHVVRLGAGGEQLTDLGPSAALLDKVIRLRADLRARQHIPSVPDLLRVVQHALDTSLSDVDTALALRRLVGDAERVVVVPTATIISLPWALLPSLRGVPVTVAPSATRWLRPRRAARHRQFLTAIAGPGLAGSQDEVEQVRRTWGSRGAPPSSDGLGTAADALMALRSARLVHLAAHGFHEHQSPLFSSLAMSDGPLFAHEFPRPVTAEHVVLSACDVGQSRVRPGDEPLGLAAALLGLGVGAVVASVAPVGDAVAGEAMAEYHRKLAAGLDAAAALARVVSAWPAAGVFCLFGSDWAAAGTGARTAIG
jgi:tetratricopeptide (TPR) repeat protein